MYVKRTADYGLHTRRRIPAIKGWDIKIPRCRKVVKVIPDELQLSITVAQLLSHFNHICVRGVRLWKKDTATRTAHMCGLWDKLWIAGLAVTLAGCKTLCRWIKLFLHSTHTLKSKVRRCPDRSGIKSLANLLGKCQINGHGGDLDPLFLGGVGGNLQYIKRDLVGICKLTTMPRSSNQPTLRALST